MLNPEERYNIWQDYRERASKFFSDVEDDLDYKFSPYRQSEADKDTPVVRRLFDMLADVSAFIERHANELEQEYSDWAEMQSNLSRCFTAWECGLCPEFMLHSNEWAGDFYRISAFK
ncbi:MAG: hypothetical protein IJS28_07150 [Synergistaceae bacterium]|nr:hypothetical protein [Synergistaceae bacterium]